MLTNNPTSHWSLMKKYMAAHYYLCHKKGLTISDAQRSQLSALHM